MTHIKALDGLRGLAIIGVVLFHYTWISCGWAGVQLFFVLSGFLITSILMADRRLQFGPYIRRFYWRRTLRIFPLYFGYLALLTVAFLFTRVPAAFATEWPFLYTYTFNYERLSHAFQNNAFYGHFWSLSIEEQFYVLWPAVVYFAPRRVFAFIIVGILALCPALRGASGDVLSATSHSPGYLGQAIYSLTFCQFDAFAAGAAVAVFGQHLSSRSGRMFVVASIVLLGAGQANAMMLTGRPALDTSLGYPINMFLNYQHVWGYTLIDLWAASLLLLACRPNIVATVLAHSTLVYIGRISYGMYVFHLVILLGARKLAGPRHSLENLTLFLLYFGVVVAVSAISYRWFESAFLRMKDRTAGRQPVTVAIASQGRSGSATE
jgi:peptidoglycan/LPS O-acetylase OafA/YrhL